LSGLRHLTKLKYPLSSEKVYATKEQVLILGTILYEMILRESIYDVSIPILALPVVQKSQTSKELKEFLMGNALP